MSKRFITFKPVTGVYEKAIQPYKKWYELADMSPLIEVDGEYYRILRLTGLINKINTRKMVICHEDGQLIKDKEVSCECAKIFFYLDAFQMNSEGMVASSKEDTAKKLQEFIMEFRKMLNNVSPKLTEQERVAMRFHLYYYEETKRYAELVAKDANRLSTYIEPIKKNQIKAFSSQLIHELGQHLAHWELNKSYIEALIIENGKKSRNIVRKILRNADYQSCFPNQRIKKEMLDEMLQSEMAVTRFLHDGKIGWEREKKWLNPNKGEFNIETYLEESWNRNSSEVFMKVSINEFIKGYWLFSPTRIHS